MLACRRNHVGNESRMLISGSWPAGQNDRTDKYFLWIRGFKTTSAGSNSHCGDVNVDALAARALKQRIARHSFVTAAGTDVMKFRRSVSDHHFEISAFYAVWAAHDVHTR